MTFLVHVNSPVDGILFHVDFLADLKDTICLCSEPEFGHGILTVIDAVTAKWEWHRNQDGNPVVTDSVVITRDGTSCP